MKKKNDLENLLKHRLLGPTPGIFRFSKFEGGPRRSGLGRVTNHLTGLGLRVSLNKIHSVLNWMILGTPGWLLTLLPNAADAGGPGTTLGISVLQGPFWFWKSMALDVINLCI